MKPHLKRNGLLVLISAGLVFALILTGPIQQDPNYHLFADTRQILGIHNFWNTLSNLPFLAVGILGLIRYPELTHTESNHGYLVMCIGVIFVSAGSAYYHHSPSNETLLWDRLPMTVVFMAVLSLILNERVLLMPRANLLWALVILGSLTVFYWSWTESIGRGDLRPYVLVQFLPVLLVPAILVMFNAKYLSNKLLLASFGLYLLAKVLEHFDSLVFTVTGTISGHSLKHLVATAAVLCLIYATPVLQSESDKSLPETYI